MMSLRGAQRRSNLDHADPMDARLLRCAMTACNQRCAEILGEVYAFWDLRSSGRQRATADPAFRGAAEAHRGVRPRRLLRLPSCRASQYAAGLRPVAGDLFVSR